MNQIVKTGQSAPAPLTSGHGISAIVPADVEQAYRLAKAVVAGRMAPKGMESPETVMIAIMHGMEVGLPPMAALQSIAVVNGRPTIWGDGAIGLVQGSGLLEDMSEEVTGDGDKMVATCTLKRKGRTSPIVRTFSVDDAKRAGLWGKSGPWSQYPRRMLQMRARSWALRDGFADVLKGLQIREDVQDYRPATGMVDVTPQDPAAALRAQITADTKEDIGEEDVPAAVEVIDEETGEITEETATTKVTTEFKPGPTVGLNDSGQPDWQKFDGAMRKRIAAATSVEELNALMTGTPGLTGYAEEAKRGHALLIQAAKDRLSELGEA
jgi:hypothetical protein